jgi:predicted RNase H-like HicB family nuclease
MDKSLSKVFITYIAYIVMAREFEVIIEKGEDGYYIGSVVGIPGCFSQAKTIDELMKRMKEAVELCLETEEIMPKAKFMGIQKLELNNPSKPLLTA